MSLATVVRRIARVGNDDRIGMDEFGNLTVSQGLPAYARLAAAGRLYVLDTHAGTAKAPVVAAPTTSPEWGLYNASPDEVLVVLEAACTLKSGTAGLGLALMMASAIGEQTLVSADYTGAIKTCTDGSQRKPDAFITNNPTLVGGTPGWAVLDATRVNTVATDSVGDGLVAHPDGKFIARPRGMVALEVVGETGTTALFSVSFLVAMLPLDRY